MRFYATNKVSDPGYEITAEEAFERWKETEEFKEWRLGTESFEWIFDAWSVRNLGGWIGSTLTVFEDQARYHAFVDEIRILSVST